MQLIAAAITITPTVLAASMPTRAIIAVHVRVCTSTLDYRRCWHQHGCGRHLKAQAHVPSVCGATALPIGCACLEEGALGFGLGG